MALRYPLDIRKNDGISLVGEPSFFKKGLKDLSMPYGIINEILNNCNLLCS